MEKEESKMSEGKKFLLIALMGGLILGLVAGAIAGFWFGVSQTNAYVNENLEAICEEAMLAPQMAGLAELDDSNFGDGG